MKLKGLPFLFVLVVASWLRFAGLGWGLRHPMHIDERYFVRNTIDMMRAGDLDHREHRYPGLFFFLLVPGFAILGPERMEGPAAYLFARGLCASFGVLNVGLLYLVGSRLVGAWGGFVGALLLAVMPLDNMTCHQVRPETALTTAAILCIASFRKIGPSLRGDVLSGLTLGLAAALKYTAPLLLPSYLFARWLNPGRRLLGALVALGLMGGISLLCTPFAILHPRRYFADTRTVMDSYYVGYTGNRTAQEAYHLGEATFVDHFVYYLKDGERALGPIAALLALAGVAICLRRSFRDWAPILLHPLTTILVMSTATLVFPRQILQAMPLMCLMAGVVAEVLGQHSRWAALGLSLLAAVIPFRASASYTESLRRPSSEDLGLDWIEAHAPAGSRILETRPEADVGEKPGAAMGIDPRKYAVLHYAAHSGPERKKRLTLLAPHMDLIITGPEGGGSWAKDLKTVYAAPDDLELRVPLHPLSCAAVDLRGADWSASESVASTGGAFSTSGPMQGAEWIQIGLKQPLPIGRVELLFGNNPFRRPPELALETRKTGRYEAVDSVEARPSLRRLQTLGLPLSELLVLAPEPVFGVRIEQLAKGDLPWIVSAIRLEACRTPPETVP